MAEPEPCTTQSRRLRHLSVDLRPATAPSHVTGRWGTTLCGYDGAHDEEYVRSGFRNPDRAERFTLAGLPPCVRCARKAGES